MNGTSSVAGMASRIVGMAVVDMTQENAGSQVESNLVGLDTVSRATCTSKSIKEACKEALKQAREKFLEENKAKEGLNDIKVPEGTDETDNTQTEPADTEEPDQTVEKEVEQETPGLPENAE